MRYRAANSTRQTLQNLLWFQVCWFTAVLGQNDWVWLIMLLLIAHLLSQSPKMGDWPVLVSCAAIGISTDILLTKLAFFAFSPSPVLAIPVWLMGLWLAFAGTLSYGLRWLQPHTFLASVLGAVFGPLSYYAGMQLGAVQFEHRLFFTMLVLALVWALLMPLFCYIAAHFQEVKDETN
ncbi:DUF2878 family protein [Bowmanella sp. Y26]|uniref:DUF2878 domain-containing protein n=1 Tax=Bowmanella yangjiangensis TaxID=2811230 RepID=UPI001BDBC881|nr:DUF2878 domain-containing protein [Bowmanella yangjiangensis]MBT1064989.1 DUF2878 family protein [Bowmanella yangjiangensis]